MNLLEVSCVFNEETVSIESNLLMKENFEGLEETLQFPGYIQQSDVQLYSNFLDSGYLKRNYLQTVRILIVADFLKQYRICEILINEIIAPQMSTKNFGLVLNSVKYLSKENSNSIINSIQGAVSENFEEFSQYFDQFSDEMLINLIVNSAGSIKDKLFLVLLKNSQVKDFLELFDKQLLKVQEMNLDPDLEFSWRVSLSNIEEKGESEIFTLNDCNICLGVIKQIEDFQVYVRGESENPSLFRALTVFQGEFHSFYYYPGTKYLPKTSQKTTTMSIKIVMTNEKFLFELMKKAADEFLTPTTLENISSTAISLIINYLKDFVQISKLIELLAHWAQANPEQSLPEAFESINWRSKDRGFWVSTINKFPVFSAIPEISSIFFKAERNEHKSFGSYNILGEAIYIDEDPCPPLSPSGNPFILDISDIKTPKTKNLFVHKPSTRTRSVNLSTSDFESTVKYNELRQKFNTPSKYQINEKLRALELIKDLKRKLLNQPLHGHKKSYSISSFFN